MMSYTLEEVKKHKKSDSLWIVNEKKVYDVTDFAGRHPGGLDVMLKHGGQEVTELMLYLQSHKHTQTAYQILEKYQIGHLVEDGDSRKGKQNEAKRRKNKAWHF